MIEPTLTVASHTRTNDQYTLTVRVSAPPESLTGISGELSSVPRTASRAVVDESGDPVLDDHDQPALTTVVVGHDSQVTWEWPADVAPADQLTESAALIRAALLRSASPSETAVDVTEPGRTL